MSLAEAVGQISFKASKASKPEASLEKQRLVFWVATRKEPKEEKSKKQKKAQRSKRGCRRPARRF